MRLLFVTSPLVGHLFPLVAQAWGARMAGHEVVVGTAGEAAVTAHRAGLPAVDVAGGQDPVARFRSQPRPHSDRPPAGSPAQGTPPEFAARLFGACSEAMAEGATELARGWRPDCVVHSALDGAGPIAAARLGVPLVQHTFAMGTMAPELMAALRQLLEPVRRKYDVSDEPAEPIAVIDPGPRSVRLGTADSVRACRFVPFNGGGEPPVWMLRPARRPRLCLTLGTVVPLMGTSTLAMLLDAMSTLDVEVVLASGRADLSAIGALPDNVRPAGYVPLSILLPTCAAIVHHGGAGTVATALAAGLPQLALPHMADQFDISAAIERRGVALIELPTETSTDRLRTAIARLLGDHTLHRHATDVAAENAALPAPAEVMSALAAEVSQR
jgi:UDP:flavonoid glycosyltransferase YjiC (YdhE family)